MRIIDVTPTQDGYRNSDETIRDMLQYIHCGGQFDLDAIRSHSCNRSTLIAITRFPDGKLFLRDGLHRVTAIWLARPSRVLFPSEYVIEEYTYEQYMNPNPPNGWYTPFDPRVEVRMPNFLDFRREAELDSDPHGFIVRNKHRYAIPRTDAHTWERLSALWPEVELSSCPP